VSMASNFVRNCNGLRNITSLYTLTLKKKDLVYGLKIDLLSWGCTGAEPEKVPDFLV